MYDSLGRGIWQRVNIHEVISPGKEKIWPTFFSGKEYMMTRSSKWQSAEASSEMISNGYSGKSKRKLFGSRVWHTIFQSRRDLLHMRKEKRSMVIDRIFGEIDATFEKIRRGKGTQAE